MTTPNLPPSHAVQTDQRELETSLLAASLVDPESIDRTSLVVGPDDFTDAAIGRLYAIAVDMRNAGEPVGVKSLYWRAKGLRIGGEMLVARVGGLGEIGRWVQQLANASHCVYYAQQIRRAAHKRRLAELAKRLSHEAEDWTVEPEQSIAVVEALSSQISARADEVLTLEQAGKKALDLILERKNASTDRTEECGHGPTRVMFGLPCLDQGVGGMYGGDLIVVGARPSIGKSAFGMQAACFNAMQGRRSLFVSIEMSAEDLAMRVIAAQLGVETRQVRSGRVSDDQVEFVRQWTEDRANSNLLLWSGREVTTHKIRAISRLMKATKQIQMVVVDYLSLIKPENKREDRRLQIGQITRDLKTMAMELRIPVVLLCQLGRAAEGTSPTIRDLKESGDIEQDADVILLMHRENRMSKVCDIDIAKVRNGAVGAVQLEFDGPSTTFRDVSF